MTDIAKNVQGFIELVRDNDYECINDENDCLEGNYDAVPCFFREFCPVFIYKAWKIRK